MTSIPPLGAPSGVSAPAPESAPDSPPQHDQRPETVRYLVGAWSTMIIFELAYVVLNIVGLVVDPSGLRQVAAEAARSRGQDVSDALITASTYGSIVIMAGFQLLILVVLLIALNAIRKRKQWALAAQRLLTVFSVFFIIRMVSLVLAPAGVATQLPVAFSGVVGSAQIIVGVAGACGLVYASRKDVKDWVGNTPAGH